MSDAITRLNTALEGRYTVLSELGEGGMATVYLADDLRHERKVALKVLKPELAAVVGGDRFLAEIKTTANLQHPHILPLFDSGEADGFLYYVMPFVEGETLGSKLEREHQLPVADAVRIATDMAEALDYAHRQGVVHRDIKPSNILIVEGRPVISDFGIALAIGAAGGGRLTETGLSVGTPHYMSPEQATGDQGVGPTADVYALGCVLYEMLVGEPPYTGSTAQAVLGKIIAGEATSVTALRKSVPPNVAAAVAMSLEKLPADRFRNAGDFAAALTDPGFAISSATAVADRSGARSAWHRFGPALTAAALVLAVWGWLRPSPAPSVLRYDLAVPEDEQYRVSDLGYFYDIAPDGTWMVRVSGDPDANQTYLTSKRRDQLDSVLVPGTDSARTPRISPDGTRIAFLADFPGQLRVIPAGGGSAVTLTDSVTAFDWLTDDSFVYTDWEDRRIYRIPAGGGERVEAFALEDESVSLRGLMEALPGERGVFFNRCVSPCSDNVETWVLDLESGAARSVFPAVAGDYVDLGHAVLARSDGTLLAAPFDLSSLEITGAAVPLMEGVATGFSAGFRITAGGTLLLGLGPSIVRATNEDPWQFAWLSRSGEVTPVDREWRFTTLPDYSGFSLSPDGTRVAIGLRTDAGDDVWIKELPDGPLSRLTQHPAREGRPYWTPDSQHVVFLSLRDDSTTAHLYQRRADGSGDVTRVLPQLERLPGEIDFSRDGRWAVLRVGGAVGESNLRDLVAFAFDGDTTEVPLLTGVYDESNPKLSPDGRWLAYNSEESGRWEIYVRPFPDVESAKVQVSTDGGRAPLWSPVSNELIYFELQEDPFLYRIMAAHFDASDGFRVSRRELVVELPNEFRAPAALANYYQISPDGERFLGMRFAAAAQQVEDGDVPRRLVVVENWLEELRARLRN